MPTLVCGRRLRTPALEPGRGRRDRAMASGGASGRLTTGLAYRAITAWIRPYGSWVATKISLGLSSPNGTRSTSR
jgi:hypothetical protein